MDRARAGLRFTPGPLRRELVEYADQQEELTARFVAHGRKRRDYLNTLIVAADHDLSMVWSEAHKRAGLTEEIGGTA